MSEQRTLKYGQLLAVPMFFISLLFLVLVAATVQEFGSESQYKSFERMNVFMYGTLLLFPIFWAEACLHFYLGSPRWKYGVIYSIFPPLRLAARDFQSGKTMWLPLMGWHEVDDELHEEVERAFSAPMIFIALMILPLLAIDYLWMKRPELAAHEHWLRVVVETGYSVTWLAFTVEFIVMFSLVEKKFRYLKDHWLDVAIICAPFIAFLRAFRLSQLLRLQQVTKATRLYRLRGVAMRVWRGVLALDMLSRIIGLDPEKRINALEEVIVEKEREIEKIREEIAELQKKVEEDQSSTASSNSES